MTKNEAFWQSRVNGLKIRHRFFTENEYIRVIGNQVITEEGYTFWISEFFNNRTDETWENDWSAVLETVDHVNHIKETTSEQIRRFAHETSKKVCSKYGNITKFNKK